MIQNGIPLNAIILETIVSVLIVSVTIITIRRYIERRRLTTFLLAVGFLFYGLAIVSSVSGKFLDYFSDVPQSELSYASVTIILSYCLVSVGNIMLYAFIEKVFLSNSEWRIFTYGFLNSINIGLLLGNNSTEPGAYSGVFPFVVVMVAFSSIVYILLIYLGLKEARNTTEQTVRIGMTFISLFGFLLLMMFVLFIMDLISIQITGNNYTLGYYLGWTSGGLACISGYLGYINPSWVGNIFGGNKS